MRRICCIPLLAVAVLLAGCTGGGFSAGTQEMPGSAAGSTLSVTAPVGSAETLPETGESVQVIWSTNEFDSGASERFYITGNGEKEELIGSLWFESSSGARELMADKWYSEPAVYSCGGVKMLITDECYATYSVSHVFSVVDGEAVEIPINGGAQMKLTPDGDEGFTALSSEFEGNVAHTWKPYWYTFSAEEMAFIPVGGSLTAESALPQGAADRIAQDGGIIREVIAFDNGKTAVNYVTEEYGAEFQYHRLYENGEEITPEDNRGHYKLPQ